MRSRRRPLTPALVLLAGACALEPSDPPASRLMPLVAGTEWRYRKSDSTEIGKPLALPVEHFTVRVRRDTTIAGTRWAIVENGHLLMDFREAGPLLLQNRADGLYERMSLPSGFPPGAFDMASRMFKYPARLGDYSTPIPPVIVSSIDTMIRVPAGEFRTVRYDAGSYLTYFV